MNSISRRDFLKLSAAAIASSFGWRASPDLWAAAHLLEGEREYRGDNFSGWDMTIGDGVFAGEDELPVSFEDIETLHQPGFSLLKANTHSRRIMAHNITFKKVLDEASFQFAHTFGYQFRLPYLPSNDRFDLNAQSIEGCLFIWDGAETRLDYGAGFQWVLNPWEEQFGRVNCWCGENGGEWVPAGYLPVDIEWHTFKMLVDFPNQSSRLAIDGIDMQSCFTAIQKPETWGTETAARLAAEIINLYPEPSGICAMHQAEFKDWFWRWENPKTARAFLPFAIK